MQGFTFHAEMPEARKSKSASKAYPFQPWTRATMARYADSGQHVNVCAVSTDRNQWFSSRGALMKECISSVFDVPNSPVSVSTCSDHYLRSRTVRISESVARQLHPALFASLDA